MKQVYYIDEMIKKDDAAGNKARCDICYILKSMGFKQINIENYVDANSKVKRLIVILKNYLIMRKKIKNESIVLWQYPYEWMKIPFYTKKLIRNYKKKGVKTIVLVHDIESFRYGTKKIEEEKQILNEVDVIIIHNRRMEEKLRENGVCNPIFIQIEIFDYLVHEKENYTKIYKKEIAIAGNLSPVKSGYIYNLPELKNEWKFKLFGKNYDIDNIENMSIEYVGNFQPSELIKQVHASFGLVWDGSSIQECIGNTGEYLRINNPHKASFYLACGLPVIAWQESAISDFLIENRVGVGLDSLENLNIILEDDILFEQLIENVTFQMKRVRSGYYTKKAVKQAISKL